MIAAKFLYYDKVPTPKPSFPILKHILALEAAVPVLHKGFLQNHFYLLYIG